MACGETGQFWHDAPWALERFIGSGGTSPNVAAMALDRFFTLTRINDLPLAMISRNIDLLWHTLIEHTELYGSFCVKRYGHLIHHRPRSAALPLDISAVRNFYVAYSTEFGPPGAEWEADAPADLVRFGKGLSSEVPQAVRWSGWPGLLDTRILRPTFPV